MKNVKLCFIVPKVYMLVNKHIKATSGGAEKQVYLLGKKLSENRNINVNYCVNDYGQNKLEKYGNINIWNAFSFKDNILVSLKNILKIVRKINPDYCIFRGDDIKIFFLAIIIKTFLKIKYIFWISHDQRVRKKSILNYLLFKNAFKIIAQTNDQKQILKKNYLADSIVIKNVFIQNKNTIKLNIKRNFILWVGRSEKWKRPEVFLELAKRNPLEKFVMIMSPATNKEKYFIKIKRSAERLKNLLFLQDLKFDDIIIYYKQTKLFVITSKEEGFSNTMMEAMEYRCPILSLTVNPDNIINKYKVGLWANNNFEKFYKYFQTLIKDDNKLNKLGFNGNKYLKKFHNAEFIKNEFIKKVI
jgi:glycosyltransferase involved in cell wall biosynthesis